MTTVQQELMCSHCPEETLVAWQLGNITMLRCPRCLCAYWPHHHRHAGRVAWGWLACPAAEKEIAARVAARLTEREERRRKEAQPWWTKY